MGPDRGDVWGRGGLLLPGVPLPLLSLSTISPGLKRGVCVKINHFPEDTDYDHDSAEYLLRTWARSWWGAESGLGRGS